MYSIYNCYMIVFNEIELLLFAKFKRFLLLYAIFYVKILFQ